METVEQTAQTFIVKVWREEPMDQEERATWQGSITHVLSGARCYTGKLSEIVSFIAPYLESMGVIGEELSTPNDSVG